MCAPSLILYVNMIFHVGTLQIMVFNLFALFLTLFINCNVLLCNYVSFYTCYVDLWISYELRLQTITPYQFCQNVVRGSNQVTVLHRKTWPLFAVVLFKQWIKERKVFVSIEQSYVGLVSVGFQRLAFVQRVPKMCVFASVTSVLFEQTVVNKKRNVS